MAVLVAASSSAMAQTVMAQTPDPDVSAQADAASMQINRLVGMLDGQISQDEVKLKNLQAQVTALQKQITDMKEQPATKPAVPGEKK